VKKQPVGLNANFAREEKLNFQHTIQNRGFINFDRRFLQHPPGHAKLRSIDENGGTYRSGSVQIIYGAGELSDAKLKEGPI